MGKRGELRENALNPDPTPIFQSAAFPLRSVFV